MTPSPIILPVRTLADLTATIALFRGYAASLDIDLGYQDFEGEMAAMPGKYAPPQGELLLARDGAGQAIGCVGLRPLPEPGGKFGGRSAGQSEVCEMKRLYVTPQGRGTGIGRRLVEALVGVAEGAGYGEMRLDTLATMASAQGLYRSLGFETMPAYYETPVVGTVFMRRRLTPGGAVGPGGEG